MRKLILTLTAGITALVATQAKAVLFTDTDTINLKLTAAGPQSSYSGAFNIVDDGFIPGYHNVWSANITFLLCDNSDLEGATFSINLENLYTTSQYTSFTVVGTTQVGIDLLASLNSDGILTYSVGATSGDFWLKSATLLADATVPQGESERVPDNGSTLLLGALALAGLAWLQRRTLKIA